MKRDARFWIYSCLLALFCLGLFRSGRGLVIYLSLAGPRSPGTEAVLDTLPAEPATTPVDEYLPPATATKLAAGELDKPVLPTGVLVPDPVFARPQQAAIKTLSPASTPLITIWYGQNQTFGQLGDPQRWLTILGNVQDSAGISALVYSLNGGPPQPLSLGPDTRRLAEPGDFAIELDTLALIGGTHQVVITATNLLGNQSVQVVQVNYQPGNTWPLPYIANWGTAANIQPIAQVVDGRWAIQDNLLRPLAFAYDRLVAIGDNTWTDYEVAVPVTIHSIDAGGFASPSNGPGVGLLVRWTGHYQEAGEQPRIGWRNLGALAWFRWSRSGGVVSAGQQMIGFANTVLATRTDLAPTFGVDYIFKMQVQSNPGAGATYRFKHWPATENEPAGWDMSAQGSINAPPTGSLLLVAHHVDASFGPVTVTPLAPARHTLIVNTVGNGTVKRIPDLADYPHGQYVRLPATGDPGHLLGNWNGALTGSANPGAFTLTAGSIVTATFVPSAELVSDNFNRCQLGEAVWSFVNPLGDAAVELNGTHALITVPAGSDHTIGAGPYSAPRLMQMAPGGNFELEVKFDSSVTTPGQMQGILVEQDANNFLHFDFRRDTAARVYIGSVLAGVASQVRRTNVQVDHPRYLRVSRVGNQWTQMYSLDGVNWVFHHAFPQMLMVNKVGVFVANAGGTAAPAHTAAIDYFFSNRASINPDDGAGLRPALSVVGSGAILLNPDKQHYSCGEEVTVTAAPAAGWNFAHWSDDLSGATNPATLVIGGGQTVTALFVQTTYSLATSVSGSGTVTIDPPQLSYIPGESVTLTAIAADGWVFHGWGGTLGDSTNPATLVMNSNQSVIAHFVVATATPTPTPTSPAEPDGTATLAPTPTPPTADEPKPDNTPTHTVTATPIAMATPTPTPANPAEPVATATLAPTPTIPGEFDPDERSTATPTHPAAPAPTDAAAPDPGQPPIHTATPAATATLPAGVPAPTIITTGDGPVVSEPPGPNYAAGQVVTLTAVPAAGWVFVRWEVLDPAVGVVGRADPPAIQVVLPDARVYQAIFAPAGDANRLYLPLISTR